MQGVSDEYIESMAQPFRNRAYIYGTIGIINAGAQQNAMANSSKSALTYYSDKTKPFIGSTSLKTYATTEQNVSKVDGSMFFLPKQTEKYSYYYGGAISNAIKGTVCITFDTGGIYNIRGLTIDFGEYYPTKIKVETDNTSNEFDVKGRLFVAEDVNFDNTTFFAITGLAFANGSNKRLRIISLSFGVVETFTNDKCISCNIKEYVSPISDSIPSKDVEITLDNQDGYYNVEDNESAISYLEFGQEIKIRFGYDTLGDGNIEWLPDNRVYLDSWSSSDSEVNFICTDLFAQDTGATYPDGGWGYTGDTFCSATNLYDLAERILQKAGHSTSDYVLDNYLKETKVDSTKLPSCGVYEALQIVANAGRCVMYDGRDGKIRIHSSFVPDRSISCNGIYGISCAITDILTNTTCDDFTAFSTDHIFVGSDQYFAPKGEETANPKTKKWGYVSKQLSGADGTFAENPKITVTYSTSYTTYGLTMKFINSYPNEFKLITYRDGEMVSEETISNSGLTYSTHNVLEDYDVLEIVFTKVKPYSRVFIERIALEEIGMDLPRDAVSENPTVSRSDAIKNIVIKMPRYSTNASDSESEISKTTRTFKSANEMTNCLEQFIFSSECQITSLGITYNGTEYKISSSVLKSALNSAFMFWNEAWAKTGKTIGSYPVTLTATVYGKTYVTYYDTYSKRLQSIGNTIEWTNPLVLSTEHAKLVADWLADYYTGRVEYEIDWRGDPRTDANDVINYENKEGVIRTIRAYQNELTFDGGFSGKLKAKEVQL